MLIAQAETPAVRPRPPAVEAPACRLCGARLQQTLLDLGCLPLANRTVPAGAPAQPTYPLHARICETCKLVQIADRAPPRIACAPAHRPHTQSAACVIQAGHYAAAMVKRLRLDTNALVIGIGSNDGLVLDHLQAAGIPVLGISPAHADDPRRSTAITFFNTETAMEIAVHHGRADLVIAHNVLPHAPDLFDFAAGFASILRPNGVISLQVPHLLALVQQGQFDAFRHDTCAYFSLEVLERILRAVGLRVFDAERVADHGGSLRIHACHAIAAHPARSGLKSVRLAETCAELDRRDLYTGFNARMTAARQEIRQFLRIRREAGRRVAACGAPARGAMLLNACGIGTDLIACVADPDPARHGRYLAGGQIPIVPMETLLDQPPDDILILPWTHAAEAAAPLMRLRQHGAQFWTPIPRITRV